MAEARAGCIAIFQWIWTLVKRPFSYKVYDSPDSQVTHVLVELDASAIPLRFPAVVPSNQEEITASIAAATSGPSGSSNYEIISRSVQVNTHPSSSSCILSSSSTTPIWWKYGVFLSFRGVDTRKEITADIH